jgi:hypothetical protein
MLSLSIWCCPFVYRLTLHGLAADINVTSVCCVIYFESDVSLHFEISHNEIPKDNA